MVSAASQHHRSIFGVGWLKLADTKGKLSHPAQTIFGVGCIRTIDTKNRSLVLIDISQHKK
jgi:hypothetical protein